MAEDKVVKKRGRPAKQTDIAADTGTVKTDVVKRRGRPPKIQAEAAAPSAASRSSRSSGWSRATARISATSA